MKINDLRMFQRDQKSPFLSPPVSPRMSSDVTTGAPSAHWQEGQNELQSCSPLRHSHGTYPEAFRESVLRETTGTNSRPPLLRSHRSHPPPISASGVRHQQSPLSIVTNPGSVDVDVSNALFRTRLGSNATAGVSAQAASAPTSPISRLTPTSAGPDNEETLGDAVDDDMALSMAELDEQERIDGEAPKTAAERRAEKRKMKRFR